MNIFSETAVDKSPGYRKRNLSKLICEVVS
jgi:hypothetical protein